MPYASKAQQGLFHAMAARGEMPMKTVREYDSATDFSKLPERKSRRKGHAGPKSKFRKMLEERMK